MFHKNTEKLESFIGGSSMVKGEISTKGTLRIDGGIEGNVSADWVVLGDKADVRGDISARGIVVGGRIEGNLKAKEIVEIKNKGQVFGEIATSKLMIAEGGIFDGRSSMHRDETKKVIDFQALEKAK
jgi:cytoskeletal protein CcmA (bactofilin family)